MRSLIIAEKPELGRAIAAAIDGSGKEVRGVIRKQNVIITWAYGHLLRLCEPDEYDGKYKKWKKTVDKAVFFIYNSICACDWRIKKLQILYKSGIGEVLKWLKRRPC
mgnify:CR=1 FL=1